MNLFQKCSERDTIIADAQSSRGKSPEERAALFRDLQHTLESIWQDLSPEEKRRRTAAARLLDPRPVPWWKNLRQELWPTDDAPVE